MIANKRNQSRPNFSIRAAKGSINVDPDKRKNNKDILCSWVGANFLSL